MKKNNVSTATQHSSDKEYIERLECELISVLADRQKLRYQLEEEAYERRAIEHERREQKRKAEKRKNAIISICCVIFIIAFFAVFILAFCEHINLICIPAIVMIGAMFVAFK